VCRREVAVVGRVCSGAEEAGSYGMSDNSIYLVDSVNTYVGQACRISRTPPVTLGLGGRLISRRRRQRFSW
jgi:hypothetical protein